MYHEERPESYMPKVINENHYPVIFICDCSGSMYGIPMNNLLKALNSFPSAVMKADPKAADLIDVAVLGFNETVFLVKEFGPVSEMETIYLTAEGETNIGAPLNDGVEMLREQCLGYSSAYNRPMIVLITDGEETINPKNSILDTVAKKYQKYFTEKKLQMWILCVDGYHKPTVAKLCMKDENNEPRFVYELKNERGFDFSQFFNLVSKSCVALSRGAPGEEAYVHVKKDEMDNLQVPDLDEWLRVS